MSSGRTTHSGRGGVPLTCIWSPSSLEPIGETPNRYPPDMWFLPYTAEAQRAEFILIGVNADGLEFRRGIRSKDTWKWEQADSVFPQVQISAWFLSRQSVPRPSREVVNETDRSLRGDG